MPEFILQTRITAPQVSGIVSRRRLNKLLEENIDKSLLLLCSPPGYGKTMLVSGWLAEKNLRCSWLNASDEMNNLFDFMSCLIHSLGKLNHDFGKNTLQVIESLKYSETASRGGKEQPENIKENCDLITGTFINEFYGSFNDDVIVVIDDLHMVDLNAGWLNETFTFLLENIPDNLHVIIITREYPKFPLTRLAAKRKMFELPADSLSFNEEETEELLDKIYSLKSTPADISLLVKNFNGWITGIHLTLHAYGGNFGNVKPEEGRVPGEIFNFFAEEIYKKLASNVQDFLLSTALLDNFNTAMCDALPGITNSKAIINELVNKNIFIGHTHTFGKADYYSYQSLFHSFLLAKTYEVKSDDDINLIYTKISAYYFDAGEINSAIKYSLKGKDFTNAIEKIFDAENKLFEEGNFEILWGWMSLIPEGIIKENARLSFIYGKLIRGYKGDLEKSLGYITSAIKLFEPGNDINAVTECKIYRADVLYLLDIREESFNELKLLERSAEKLKISHENEAKLYLSLGRVYFSTGEYDTALGYLERTIEICRGKKLMKVQNNAFNIIGSIYVLRGEFIKSLFYYEQLADESNDVYARGRAIATIVFLYGYTGNYEKAKEYIDDLYRMQEIFPGKHFELGNCYTEAKFRNIAGDWEESNRLLEKTILLANKLNRKYYLSFCYLMLVENYYALGKTAQAMQHLEISREYIDNSPRGNLLYKTYEAILKKETSVSKDIEKILLESLNLYSSHKLQSEMVQMKFHLADYYFKSGDKTKSLTYLEEALKTASENEYVSIFENKIFFFRELLEQALIENKYKEFLTGIVKRVLEKDKTAWLSAECRQRLSKQIEDYYDISMATFGTLEFTVRGKSVAESKWKRKISKLLLAYLTLHPVEKINKDKIVDIFFGELPMDKAEPQLHNAITNIRNALKKSDTSPQYIVYQNKVLGLNNIYYYKSDAEEFNSLYGLAFSKDIDAGLKKQYTARALELYKGEFLRGYNYEWCKILREEFKRKYEEMRELRKKL